MKKIVFISCILILIEFLSIPTNVIAIESEDRIYISKTGDLWNDYTNMMNIIFPGEKVSGLYYHKLYAEYDSSVGGFVIKDKIASHISYTKKVEKAAFGLCFSYNPEYKTGREFGKKNYSVWSKLRSGDILYPHGIDFTKKTIESTGNLSDGNLNTNAYFTVSYAKRKKEPTDYSSKTVVALGDSVTCNGGWTEAVGDLLGCEIINSGVSADRATEALLRFDSDVAAYNPDIVLVMFGINDCVQYYYSEKTVQNFKKELIQINEKCCEIGAKAIYITPNKIKTQSLNFDRYQNYGGLSECYPKFIEAIKDVANEVGSYYIDIYSLFTDDESMLCDSVHPNEKGYSVIISEISNFLISYADRICGEELEGFIPTGIENTVIENGKLILKPCLVSDIKRYFCNEIIIYNNGNILSDNDIINDDCLIYWIDSNGYERDGIEIITKE